MRLPVLITKLTAAVRLPKSQSYPDSVLSLTCCAVHNTCFVRQNFGTAALTYGSNEISPVQKSKIRVFSVWNEWFADNTVLLQDWICPESFRRLLKILENRLNNKLRQFLWNSTEKHCWKSFHEFLESVWWIVGKFSHSNYCIRIFGQNFLCG